MWPPSLRRLWQAHFTLRMRLTLWYLFSLTVVFLFFSTFVHTRVQDSLRKQVDTSLRLAADRAQGQVSQDQGHLVFSNPDELADLTDDFTFRLKTADGRLSDSLGDQTAPGLTSLHEGFATLDEKPNRNGGWRLYTQAITTENGALLGWLQVGCPSDIGGILHTIRSHFCAGILIGLILASLGAFSLARRALSPIDAVIHTAQNISAQDLQQRLHYQGPQDEVGRLATTFDQMLDRIQAGFERERRFTGDAAHELRTPLTALKGQIGVTLSRVRSPGDYEAVLHDLEGQVDRLIRLSTDLLLLTRLEHSVQAKSFTPIPLDDLIGALLDQIAPLVESKHLTVITDLQAGLVVYGSVDLLIRLFLNLIDNAITYTPENGTITLRAARVTNQNRVSIGDTGPGIPAEHVEHIFERFYRVDSDRARRADGSTGGTGLGLAIAQEIALIHGGQITVESRAGQGCTFTVSLPAAAKPE